MRRRNRLKSVLAFVLATAMVLTEPAQSMVCVQAVEEQAMEGIVSEDETKSGEAEESETMQEKTVAGADDRAGAGTETGMGSESDTSSEPDSAPVSEDEAPSGQTEMEETDSESATEKPSSAETEGATETQESTIDASEEDESALEHATEGETTEEGTTEETTTEETEEEATEEEEQKLSAQDKDDAVALSVNKKENFVIRKDEEVGWYSFTLQEDGAYALSMTCRGVDGAYSCRTSGFTKWFYNGDYVNDDDYYCDYYMILFIGKAGETVYIQPYVYNYVWTDYELTETQASLEIFAAEKGTVTADSDGKYVLSCKGASVGLNPSINSTSIRLEAASQNEQDYYSYLGVCYSGMDGYNHDVGYRLYGMDSEYYDLYNLEIGTEYHMEYVLYTYDQGILAWFDGTGMPFDITTRQTDKVGGEISKVTTGFASIAVKYELFSMDTAGYGGYIRYRKADEEEWIYMEEDAYDYETDSITIYADSETSYVIELVSRDKKTVYDSAEVTTEKYNGTVIAKAREDSIRADYALIDITGFDTGIERLEVRAEYTDSFGENYTWSDSYWSYDIRTGTVNYPLQNLKAGTEYSDVKIRIESISHSNGKDHRELIYAGLINSFTTKESSIKAENINFEVTATGQRSAELKVTIDGIPQDSSMEFYSQYRRKGDMNWRYGAQCYLPNIDSMIALNNLESDTDYEMRYRVDGIAGIYEFHYTPAEFTGSVKPEIKITDTYVNGLELECSLNGADSKDTYTCRFEVYCNNGSDGSWGAVYPYNRIKLDTEKPVRQQVYGYNVYPGQKQKWRYRIYQNGSEYYVGYFESETKPLELEFSSIRSSLSSIWGTCKVDIENWKNVIKHENDSANIETDIQIRKKGQEAWKQFEHYGDLYFNKDGVCNFSGYWEDMLLEPRNEYEIRFVSYGDDSIVYEETSFIKEGSWSIYNTALTYNPKTNNSQYINIYNNYEKPTVEVENEGIVSVREIRQARIYLNIHNMGTTKLYVTADGITKEVTVTISLAQKLYYLEGADTSLADMKLPENFSWVNSGESPRADDENKVQYFEAKLEEGDDVKYVSIPVEVGKLENVDIRGKETVGAGKESVCSVYYDSIGSNVDNGTAYKITQKWTGNDNLKVTGKDNERNVTVTGGNTAGTYDLTLTVTVKNLSTGNIYETEKMVKKVRVIGAGLTDNLIIKPAEQQPADVMQYTVGGSVVSGTIIEVDYEAYEKDRTKNKVQLEAKTDTGATGIKDASVNWDTRDTDVVEVNNTGLVTVKGGGEGRILVTAEDEGGYSTEVVFRVYDSAPVFGSTSLTVRQGNAEGTRLSYDIRENNSVTGMKITDAGSQLELIQGDSQNAWYLRTKTGSNYSAETTEPVTLEITTVKKVYTQTLMVTVLPKPKADKATASFKQTVKPNLFYVDSEAVFTVTSSYEIEEIRTKEEDQDKANFHVKGYDAASGQLTLTANQLSSSTIGDYTRKNSPNAVANIEVKFKGFDEYVPFSNKVSVQNKALSVKGEDAVVTEKSESALIDVLNGKNAYDISGSDVTVASVKPAAQAGNFQAEVIGGQLKITYKGTGTANYKLTVNHPDWTKAINLSGKVSKVNVSKLSLKVTKTKAILNTTYSETVRADYTVKGNGSLPVTLNYSCKPETDALKIDVEKNRTVTVSVAEGRTVKNGKYTVSVWGEAYNTKTKVTNLTITVTDKIPTITLSAKGSINMANRELSGITYTAAIKNTDAEISMVKITDRNQLRFSVKKDSGKKLTMKALKNAGNIVKNTKYPVELQIVLSNGYVHKMTVNVKPVNKLPKITVKAPKKPTILLKAKNSVKVTLAPEKGYQIEKVVLANGKDNENFKVIMNEQNALIIQLANNSNGVKTKTYTVKYQIHITGADNSKPVTKSIKVTVKE